MPIKDQAGAIEAEVFFVAYTQDGADPSKRALTFAFNGGPGSASIWLHMGALGPRKVVLQKDGFMPEAPYRLMDNSRTPLDKTDVVLVDTAGRLHTRNDLMEELRKVRRVVARLDPDAPQEVLAVLDAHIGQNSAQQVKVFRDAVGLTGLAVTKMDGSARAGVVLGIEEELGVPTKLVGIGEGLDDLDVFEPSQYLQALLRMESP